ncbi:GC-rich sequence DNA-binding factor-like protein, partial [Trifolium medium]|nr:GC-rich sequence DNA-binding factor-like protein [Trifolium medium]
HKAFYIEELEDQMKKLHEDRASAIFEKRAANNDDEMIEVEAAVKAATSVLSRKGDNMEAARSAAQDAFASVRKQRDFPVKLDEFGGDLNREKRMKMKVMVEARQRRRSKAFDSKKLAS